MFSPKRTNVISPLTPWARDRPTHTHVFRQWPLDFGTYRELTDSPEEAKEELRSTLQLLEKTMMRELERCKFAHTAADVDLTIKMFKGWARQTMRRLHDIDPVTGKYYAYSTEFVGMPSERLLLDELQYAAPLKVDTIEELDAWREVTRRLSPEKALFTNALLGVRRRELEDEHAYWSSQYGNPKSLSRRAAVRATVLPPELPAIRGVMMMPMNTTFSMPSPHLLSLGAKRSRSKRLKRLKRLKSKSRSRSKSRR